MLTLTMDVSLDAVTIMSMVGRGFDIAKEYELCQMLFKGVSGRFAYGAKKRSEILRA